MYLHFIAIQVIQLCVWSISKNEYVQFTTSNWHLLPICVNIKVNKISIINCIKGQICCIFYQLISTSANKLVTQLVFTTVHTRWIHYMLFICCCTLIRMHDPHHQTICPHHHNSLNASPSKPQKFMKQY